ADASIFRNDVRYHSTLQNTWDSVWTKNTHDWKELRDMRGNQLPQSIEDIGPSGALWTTTTTKDMIVLLDILPMT
ncbi:unnamed protein product, partial [Ceratitis capitata]